MTDADIEHSPDVMKLKSYVWYGDECFYISTIERDSSAMVEPPPRRYHETIAWQMDWATDKRGDIVAMSGSGPALTQHFEMCRQLYRTGKFNEDDTQIQEDAP